MALPPSCRMAVTTSLTAAWSRPCTATAAPRRASSVTTAAPIPRELPVTRATWPASVLMPHSFQLRGGCPPWGWAGSRMPAVEAHVDGSQPPASAVADDDQLAWTASGFPGVPRSPGPAGAHGIVHGILHRYPAW